MVQPLLPEVGDPEKPKLVFFFDEGQLLCSDLPKIFEDKVVQIVRLIRSKGVGVYFLTQNPLGVPQTVLGQPGNRVQHALRACSNHRRRGDNLADAMAESAARAMGISLARQIVGGVWGSLLGGR